MDELPILTLNEIEKYLTRTGKKGAMVVSILGRLNKHFNAVISSDIGKEILSDDINRVEELMDKIYKEEANEQELAEFRYLKNKRIPDVVKRVKAYLEKVGEVKRIGTE